MRGPWRFAPWLLAALVAGTSTLTYAEQDDAADDAVEAADDTSGDEPAAAEIDPDIFDEALRSFYEGNFDDAAAGFWGYVHFGTPSAKNYEWSRFFLAESLAALGLHHAATAYYVMVAKTAARPELVPEALRRLEAITRERPFDEELVYGSLIYDTELGALPAGVADWARYVQGLYDFKNGFDDWGTAHLAAIDKESPYFARGLYVRAVQAVKEKHDELALELFADILADPNADTATKNDANIATARLHFDQGDYARAKAAYDQVVQTQLSFGQAELLLEKAWVAFNLGEQRRAMGLLHALDAPSYRAYFLPDVYLLRGVILKQLCHFLLAKQAVREFRNHYRRALAALKARTPIERIDALRIAASQEGSIGRRTAFLRTLRDEEERLESYRGLFSKVELYQHLVSLYRLEKREQLRLWWREFEPSADRVASDLLQKDEQMRLLDYEIGLDIFKRLDVAHGRRDKQESLTIPYDSANVYYQFDTEYWNDELHSYQYFITNRCFEAEGTP